MRQIETNNNFKPSRVALLQTFYNKKKSNNKI